METDIKLEPIEPPENALTHHHQRHHTLDPASVTVWAPRPREVGLMAAESANFCARCACFVHVLVHFVHVLCTLCVFLRTLSTFVLIYCELERINVNLCEFMRINRISREFTAD